MKKRGICIVASVAVVLTLLLGVFGCAQSTPASTPTLTPTPTLKPTPKVETPAVVWKISAMGMRRAQSEGVEFWASEMAKRTGGRFKAEIVYGEALAPATQFIDGIKDGLFQAATVTSGLTQGKLPLSVGHRLTFIHSITDERILARWRLAVLEYPPLVAEWGKWNAMVLMGMPTPVLEIMSTKPIRNMSDLKGLRMSVPSGSDAVFKAAGVVASAVPSPERYDALQRGLVDAVTYAWTYGFGSFSIHEVAKYAVMLHITPPCDEFAVNKDAWAKLPDDWKKIALDLREPATQTAYDAFRADDKKWLPIFEKAGVKTSEWAPEERAKLVALAEPAWDNWVKQVEDKGLPGRDVLNFMRTTAQKFGG